MKSYLLAASVAILMALGALPVLATGGQGHDSVTICHRTNSDTNPYVVITVDDDAVDGVAGNSGNVPDHFGEHQGPGWELGFKEQKIEWGDIIPNVTDEGNPLPHNGLNWDTVGQAIYNNGCQPPSTPTSTSSTSTSTSTTQPGSTTTSSTTTTSTPTTTSTTQQPTTTTLPVVTTTTGQVSTPTPPSTTSTNVPFDSVPPQEVETSGTVMSTPIQPQPVTQETLPFTGMSTNSLALLALSLVVLGTLLLLASTGRQETTSRRIWS